MLLSIETFPSAVIGTFRHGLFRWALLPPNMVADLYLRGEYREREREPEIARQRCTLAFSYSRFREKAQFLLLGGRSVEVTL